MTSAGALRAILSTEPSVACAVDNDDNEGGSSAMSSLKEEPDEAGAGKGPIGSKISSPTPCAPLQQLKTRCVVGRDARPVSRADASVAQLGWSTGFAGYRNNRGEEPSSVWPAERACGHGGAAPTTDPLASTMISRRSCRPTVGHGHGCQPVDPFSEKEGSVTVATAAAPAPLPLTRKGSGVATDEARRLIVGGPGHDTAPTAAAVVPCPPGARVAQEQHQCSVADNSEMKKGAAVVVATVDGGVCGWERRRTPSGRKHPAPAVAPVYTAVETRRDRYPSGAGELFHNALVEREKIPPEAQAEMVATASAKVVTLSATTVSSSIATKSCAHQASPERANHEGECEGRRSSGRSGVVSDHVTTRHRSCELDPQQRRREMMVTDPAADGDGSRSVDLETKHASDKSIGVEEDKYTNGDGENREDKRRTASPAEEEKAEVVPAAACASGEDTDDEPLSGAARRVSGRPKGWPGERLDSAARSAALSTTTEMQSDRWTELEESIPKLEGRVSSDARGVSPANDPADGVCAPARLTTYVLKSSAPVHRQLAGEESHLPWSPDDGKRPQTGDTADGFDSSSTSASREVGRDSRGRGEGMGGVKACTAAEPDQSKTTSTEGIATVGRRVSVERAPLSDAEDRPISVCGEATVTAGAASPRRRDAEANDATPDAGEMSREARVERLRKHEHSTIFSRGVLGLPRESEQEALRIPDFRRGGRGGSSTSSSSRSGSVGPSDVDDYLTPPIALMSRPKQNGELSARSGVEKAAAALAAVPTAAKAAKAAAIAVGRPIIPGVPPGAIVDDAEASPCEDCPVEVGIGNSGELVYSFKKSGRPRRGKWSRVEEEFAKRIINDFDDGVLDAPAGIGLRQLLASKLRCEVMRVSKKFSGWACVGKRSFRPIRYADGKAARAQATLHLLEQRWLKTFVPSSTLPVKSPALESSSFRPPAPSSRSLMRLVPAPPAVERDGGLRSLKKVTTPEQMWLDRAKKALASDCSVSAMDSLIEQGRNYVSKGGERGVGDVGRNGSHCHDQLAATNGLRLGMPRFGCNVGEGRRYHSVAEAHLVRGHPGATPYRGGGENDELQWWVVSGSNKAPVVGRVPPEDQRQQRKMEHDHTDGSSFTRHGVEQLLARANHDRGRYASGTRPGMYTSSPPSLSAQHPWSDSGDAREPGYGQDRAKSLFRRATSIQRPGSYAQHHGEAQAQPRGEERAYFREQVDNHDNDRRVGSPRDVESPWQHRQTELQQDARSAGGENAGAGAGAGGDVTSSPFYPVFSRPRINDGNMDAPLKITSVKVSAAGGDDGDWTGTPTSSPSDRQGRVKVQAARPPHPRSPCTISRLDGGAGPPLTVQVGEGGRSDDYPHFRRQVVSPGEDRAGEGGGMNGGSALDQRERGGGSASTSAAWCQGSLPLPGSRRDDINDLEGDVSSGSPMAAATARRPGPFRLKPPTALPPHLRVEHDGASFFPGNGREGETAAGYGELSKSPHHDHHLQRDSAQRQSGDDYRLRDSFDSERELSTTKPKRSYWEENPGGHQRPFKSRCVDGDGSRDRRYDIGYRTEFREKRPTLENSDSVAVKPPNDGWRQYATERDLIVEAEYAAARSKPTGGADVPRVPEAATARASSSIVMAAHANPREGRFKIAPAHSGGDMWEGGGAHGSRFHPPTRGFVVPAGGHLVLRVEASPELGRSSGIIREPYAACQD